MQLHRRLPLVICVLLMVSSSSSDHHAITSKSCDRAHSECRQYLQLNDLDNGHPELHCALIVVRGWDDSRGPDYPVFRRFWRGQYREDTCYVQRTLRCLNELQANDSTDSVWRAARTRDCFNDQYGQADTTLVEHLKPFGLRLRQVVRDCVDILQLSEVDLAKTIAEGDWRISKPLSCLLRCSTIRFGLYTDDGGPQITQLELLYGSRSVEKDQFRQRAERCTARVGARYSSVDNCSLVTHVLDECFDDLLQELFGIIGGPRLKCV